MLKVPEKPDRLCFLDTETRAGEGLFDLRAIGTYRYADAASVILVTYDLGDGVQAVERQAEPLTWDDLPDDLQDAIYDPACKLVAFNAGFDRAILNYALPGCPFLAPERFLDAMASCLAANLPGDLDGASLRLFGPEKGGKQKDGKALIKLFSQHDYSWRPEDAEAWQRFVTYGKRDVDQLRQIWAAVPLLRLRDWQAYWTSERINERGMAVDLPMCRGAAQLAIAFEQFANKSIAECTNGVVDRISQAKRLAGWAYDRLDGDEEAQDFLVRNWIEVEEDEPEQDYDVEAQADAQPHAEPERYETPRLTIARQPLERLIDYLKVQLETCSDYVPDELMAALELREFGGSSTPKKFQKILDQQVGGRLRGQFTFNGAATGRWSGKGAQPQNLSRTPLGGDYGDHEEEIADMIARGCSLTALAAAGDGESPARKLSLIIRNAIVAPAGKTLVKADYAQVEARALPWLAKSRGAEKRLDYFRACDADPSLPDLYSMTAAQIFHCAPEEVSKVQRQAGKIDELACGYNGGVHAVQGMAAKFRVYLSEEEARDMVQRWRGANGWAVEFWGVHNSRDSYGLWGAAMQAYEQPGRDVHVGRVALAYDRKAFGGSGALIMGLPSGRILTYPYCKMREHKIIDKRTGDVIDTIETLTYLAGRGFRALSKAVLANNCTQGACADLLRESIVRIDPLYPVVLHAHDEIVLEVHERDAEQAAYALERAMIEQRPWATGLPLKTDSTIRWFYSAAKARETA